MPLKKPRLISLTALSGGLTPVNDSTTYYMGNSTLPFTTTPGTMRIVIPRPGRIKGAVCFLYSNVTPTAEDTTVNLRLNDTTNYLVQTKGMGATTVYNNQLLDIPVVAGDFVQFQFVGAAWVTNPDNVRGAGGVIIEVA